MGGQGTVVSPVGRLRLPDELSFILQQNMLIRTFDKEALDSKMGKYGKGGLRMSKGISRYSCPGEVAKLFLQEVKTKLEVLNNVVVVGTAFVMLHVASAQYFPILSFQKLSNLSLDLFRLLDKPMFEKSHL